MRYPFFIGFFEGKFVALAEKFERYEELFAALREFFYSHAAKF